MTKVLIIDDNKSILNFLNIFLLQQEKYEIETLQDSSKAYNILDKTIRPALQMHGGNLQLLKYENNILIISYQGACGLCPSAAIGTLDAIQNILQEQYNSEILVKLA